MKELFPYLQEKGFVVEENPRIIKSFTANILRTQTRNGTTCSLCFTSNDTAGLMLREYLSIVLSLPRDLAPTCIDVFSYKDTTCCLYQYDCGMTLDTYLSLKKKLTPAQKMNLILPLIKALNYFENTHRSSNVIRTASWVLHKEKLILAHPGPTFWYDPAIVGCIPSSEQLPPLLPAHCKHTKMTQDTQYIFDIIVQIVTGHIQLDNTHFCLDRVCLWKTLSRINVPDDDKVLLRDIADHIMARDIENIEVSLRAWILRNGGTIKTERNKAPTTVQSQFIPFTEDFFDKIIAETRATYSPTEADAHFIRIQTILKVDTLEDIVPQYPEGGKFGNLWLKPVIYHFWSCELAILSECRGVTPVVQLLGIAERWGLRYLVLEALEMSLHAFLFRAPRYVLFEDKIVLNIFRQCAEAVAALHEKHIYHLDIKADNFGVNLDASGNVAQVKIMDFDASIAPLTARTSMFWPQKATMITHQAPEYYRTGVYDDRYASESFFISDKARFQKIDIWSLGITLAEIMTRQRPFEPTRVDFHVMAAIHQQWSKNVIFDSANIPISSYNHQIIDLFYKCTEIIAKNRPSAPDLVAMCQAILL